MVILEKEYKKIYKKHGSDFLNQYVIDEIKLVVRADFMSSDQQMLMINGMIKSYDEVIKLKNENDS